MDARSVFSSVGSAGHYLAVGISYVSPKEEVNALPADWIQYYCQFNLMLIDPMLRWAVRHEGAVRFDDLPGSASDEVLHQARAFGLNYGAVFSVRSEKPAQRSYAITIRGDRGLTDAELARCHNALRLLHSERTSPPKLTKAEIEALKMLQGGMRFKQISHELGVTEGAIKQRLINARRKMGAINSLQATTIASGYGLL